MKIGMIGAGNMGSALAKAMAEETKEIFLSDADTEKAALLAAELGITVGTNASLAAECDILFLAVKPQVLPTVLAGIRDTLRERAEGGRAAVLVSMAAGVSTDAVLEILGFASPLIRIMPNTPVAVGAGMVLYTTRNLPGAAAEQAFLTLMKHAGILQRMEESKIDAASAISGCGPAFCYMFAEAMAMGGVRCGLPYEVAKLLAAQTMLGSARMMLSTTENPESLKVRVCSPAGTTVEGVCALEAGAFNDTVIRAVSAAYDRTLELAKKK